MIKRITWFAAGAAVGTVGTVAAGRKLKQAADQLRPVNVAKSAAIRVKARGQDVAAAVREGRAQARAKETQLRAARDGSLPDDPFAVPAGTTVNYIVVNAAEVPGLTEALTATRGAAKGPRRTARRAR
jgi:hypothetical protein